MDLCNEPLTAYGWVLLHDRRVRPSSTANIDHLLIAPPTSLCLTPNRGRCSYRLGEEISIRTATDAP
jgi:hypothetical protein